jgi:hypothetical protein
MDRAHALIDNIFVRVWHERGKLSITIGHGIFRSTHSLPISDTGFDDMQSETTKEKAAYSDPFADFSVSLVSKTRLCCDILCGVLKVHVMRTDEKDCSMLCDKLSTGVLDKHGPHRTGKEHRRLAENRTSHGIQSAGILQGIVSQSDNASPAVRA